MFSMGDKKKDVSTPRICDVVWHDGEFIKWSDARVHVMSHVLHYGSSVFEGIRCYATKRGPAVFRLREHMQRFLNSAKVYRMDHKWSLDDFCDAAVELVRRSNLEQCYIRPILFRSLDEEHPAFGVNPFPNPLACYIGAWDWGKYLGDEAIEKGVDVCVSSWNRLTPNSLPAMAKSGANYMNSQLIKMEALINGFAEGIALDDRGYVSEGSGENIFLVSNGVVPGITRDSVIQICNELGITIKERSIQRAALYVADELFFSGTAAEITPIRSVDRINIGTGQRGDITENIQKIFFEITSGERQPPGPWLTYVREQDARAADRPASAGAENGSGRNAKKRGVPPTMEAELVAKAQVAAVK